MAVCVRCGHESGSDAGIQLCERCAARMAFGKLVPHVVVKAAEDDRFVTLSFDGHTFEIDIDLAAELAGTLTNVVGR